MTKVLAGTMFLLFSESELYHDTRADPCFTVAKVWEPNAAHSTATGRFRSS